MIIPIRCFTCGKVVAHYWKFYSELLHTGYTEEQALDAIQFTRFCCRRMFLTHVDFCDSLLAYNPAATHRVEHELENMQAAGAGEDQNQQQHQQQHDGGGAGGGQQQQQQQQQVAAHQ